MQGLFGFSRIDVKYKVRKDTKFMTELSNAIMQEVKKVIVGKGEVIEKVLMAMLAGGHILLEDVPGVGKTTLALAFSRAMQFSYQRIQFTPDTVPSDIVGFSVYNRDNGRFEFQKGAVFCNLLLGDELNRTSSKTQSALLEVMEEGAVTVDGMRYAMKEPFIVIATQNPIGTIGTQNLPESQLDRFMAKISMGYPTIEEQVELMRNRQFLNPLQEVEPVVTAAKFLEMKERVKQVHVTDEVLHYIASLCEATRDVELVQMGVSPRGGIAVCNMAKAAAFLENRDYVIPEDVKRIFTDVCAHRLVLKPQAKMEGVNDTGVCDMALKNVDAPNLTQVMKRRTFRKTK